MTFTSDWWASPLVTMARRGSRTSQTLRLRSTLQLMKTVASEGDHCTSSTEPVCSPRPPSTTQLAPPSPGCHTWMRPAQSPVASCPTATGDQSSAKPSSRWPSKAKTGPVSPQAGLAPTPLRAWAWVVRSKTRTTESSPMVATVAGCWGQLRTRLTAAPLWATLTESIFGSQSSQSTSSSSSSAARLIASSESPSSTGRPALGMRCRSVSFITVNLFASGVSAWEPVTAKSVCGKRLRLPPSSSRRMSKLREGHSGRIAWYRT
mmetsp:Transcript_43318/g.97909  ORF Transcript_43318/g.97909 Transcript_43318/m.97909 type:complete len:263 (+) Transcript_43318:528-1316(+)